MSDIAVTVPFDFDSLYTATKTKFADKGYDTAEGSNTSQLITAMAYLTSMLNVNTAVNINETILPLARKVDNAKQAARALGYEVAHMQSYKYRLTLSLAAGNVYTIPKYTPFYADGKTYYYMGNTLEIDNSTGTSAVTVQVDVKEGTLYKFADYPSTLSITTVDTTDPQGNTIPQYYVDVPYVNVENDGLEVFLTYYDSAGNLYTQQKWNENSQFMVDKGTILNKEYIRLDDIEYNTPRIYFKIAGIGQGLRAGTIVQINVLTTSGAAGAITQTLSPSLFTFSLQNGITCTDATILLNGSNEESLASIQENAPLFYNSANRAVTRNDYTAICNRHQAVRKSMIWGGDDEYPKSPGHIWFSFLPSTYTRTYTQDTFNTTYTLDNPESETNWFVQNEEIRSTEYNVDGTLINPGVWDVLDNYKIPTFEFHNRNPIYLDFTYSFQILKYQIKTSKADINQSVFNIVDDIFTGNNDVLAINDFDQEYFHGSLEKRIDRGLTDITGFNSTLSNKLMITTDNITAELSDLNYRDIFIPLAVPFESYFDANGNLLTSVLPNIDTTSFAGVYDLTVDWTGGGNSADAVITAPINASTSETFTATAGQTAINLNVIDFGSSYTTVNSTPTDVNLVVTVNGTAQTISTDYSVTSATQITLVNALNAGDTVVVSVKSLSGYYYLFNDYRKYIIVQLFVNAENYSSTTTPGSGLYSDPKSYLTTVDGYYGYTTDKYYVTTAGYVVQYPSDTNVNSGSVVLGHSTSEYLLTTFRYKNFENKTSYLNFAYNSYNFKTIRNVVPRLREVDFI